MHVCKMTCILMTSVSLIIALWSDIEGLLCPTRVNYSTCLGDIDITQDVVNIPG